MEKKLIVRSNREYDYFGNVLEYEYDYFPSYSSTSSSTQKVLVLEYEYKYKYTSTITPSLQFWKTFFYFGRPFFFCYLILYAITHNNNNIIMSYLMDIITTMPIKINIMLQCK